MSDERPNIVFFWDNLGWDEVGCYGAGISIGAASYCKHHCGAASRPNIPGGSTDDKRFGRTKGANTARMEAVHSPMWTARRKRPGTAPRH